MTPVFWAATVAALVVLALIVDALDLWDRLRAVGGELGERLDELAAAGTGQARSVPATSRYARFEHRDYSGDRGPTPTPTVRYPTVYDEVCARLGFRP